MGSRWPTVQLSKVADLHTNKIDPRRVPDQEVRHFSLPAFDVDARPVVELGSAIASAKTTVPEDAVLLSKLNPHIPRTWVPRVEPGVLNLASTEFLVLQPRPGIDRHYLAYAVQSPVFQESFRSAATGTSGSHQRVPASVAMSCAVPLPDPLSQQGIVAVLKGLDDKIELNRRMVDTLVETTQTLFRLWFVEPAGRRGPSGDELPNGWRPAELGEIVDVIDCLHSKKPDRVSDGRPLLQLNNVRADGLLDLSDTYSVSDADYAKWISRMEARQGDCVITNVGRSGAVSQVPYGVAAALGRNMTGLRPRPEYPYPTFLIELLLSSPMRREIELKLDAGTILESLNVRSIPKLRFALPDRSSLRRFENVARPLRERAEALLVNTATLNAIRDTLLPPLLDGRIEVPPVSDREVS